MAKKLIRRYLLEIYSVDEPIEIDKQEVKEQLVKVVKDKLEKEIVVGDIIIPRDKLRQLAEKRKKEIDDYYSGAIKIDTQANKHREEK